MEKIHSNLPRQSRTETSSQFTFEELLLKNCSKKKELKKKTHDLSIIIPKAKIKMAAAFSNSKMDRGRCESKERPFRFIRPFFLYPTSSSTGRLEAHAGSEGICVPWPYRLPHVNTHTHTHTHTNGGLVGCWGPRTRLGTPSLKADFLDM